MGWDVGSMEGLRLGEGVGGVVEESWGGLLASGFGLENRLRQLERRGIELYLHCGLVVLVLAHHP